MCSENPLILCGWAGERDGGFISRKLIPADEKQLLHMLISFFFFFKTKTGTHYNCFLLA